MTLIKQNALKCPFKRTKLFFPADKLIDMAGIDPQSRAIELRYSIDYLLKLFIAYIETKQPANIGKYDENLTK